MTQLRLFSGKSTNPATYPVARDHGRLYRDVQTLEDSWATLNERCTAALQARNESLHRERELLNRYNALKRQFWLAVMWGVCIGFGVGLVVGLMF